MSEERHKVVVQKWEESERGWGQRPDGFSLHMTDTDREAYIKDYWARQPREVPDEYSRPEGTPYATEVDAETYAQVKASKYGIRDFGRAPAGATDGWISLL